MNKNTKMITGTIKQNNETIHFYCEGFSFVFLRCREVDSYDKLILESDQNGYIWGVTNDNKGIAIFTKQDVEIYQTKELNTWNYIIFSIPMYLSVASDDSSSADKGQQLYNSISGIFFQNGPIKSVFPCNAIKEDFDEEERLNKKRIQDSENENEKDINKYLVYIRRNQIKEFIVREKDEDVYWRFGTIINKNNSVDEGYELKNVDSYLMVLFEKKRDLGAFYDYYGYVSAIMSFLTFRRNVLFENIKLLMKDNNGRNIPFADCYIQTEGKEISKRSMMNSLSVYMLSDKTFQMLFDCEVKNKNLSKRKEKNIYLPLSVIPKNDADEGWITRDKIRDICSCLEAEIDAANIVCGKDDELNKLVVIIKSIIRNHRKRKWGNGSLNEKTYNNLFNSISHWGDSAADRAIKAWHENYEECIHAIGWWKITITDEDIANLIKTRNDITHRGFREFSEKDANTAIGMSVLIYILAMKRVGIEKDVIKQLAECRFFG